MKSKSDIDIWIEGRKYTITSFESDEYVQQIASFVNRKLEECKKNGNYNRMELAVRYVLLAINIADDYFKMKKEARDYRAENQAKDKTVLDMKHKIIDLQEQKKKDEKTMDELEKALEDAEKKIVELETRLKQRK